MRLRVRAPPGAAGFGEDLERWLATRGRSSDPRAGARARGSVLNLRNPGGGAKPTFTPPPPPPPPPTTTTTTPRRALHRLYSTKMPSSLLGPRGQRALRRAAAGAAAAALVQGACTGRESWVERRHRAFEGVAALVNGPFAEIQPLDEQIAARGDGDVVLLDPTSSGGSVRRPDAHPGVGRRARPPIFRVMLPPPGR